MSLVDPTDEAPAQSPSPEVPMWLRVPTESCNTISGDTEESLGQSWCRRSGQGAGRLRWAESVHSVSRVSWPELEQLWRELRRGAQAGTAGRERRKETVLKGGAHFPL